MGKLQFELAKSGREAENVIVIDEQERSRKTGR